MTMKSDESGEIIEAPQASEVFETLEEPKKIGAGPEYEATQLWKARIDVARKVRDKKLDKLLKKKKS